MKYIVVDRRYTEEEAMDYIKKYFDFYEPDQEYNNVRFRRLSTNSFHVSIGIRPKETLLGADWSHMRGYTTYVYSLDIYDDDSYSFKRSFHH